MELVQAFNAELSSLYEVKPPISKAKMSQITKVAIKGIKMYKHIVQSVERFIAKCRPEYKIPGLYVIDSIVRQSRHQFNTDRDVFGPRFIRNFPQTFQNLFLTCPPEDKPKIVRVLNLWQRNNVFSAEIIQPLLDMANPNANLGQLKYEGSPSSNANDNLASKNDPDANLVLHLQQLATQLGVQLKGANNGANPPATGSSSSTEGHNLSQSTVKFNKKLLDFDYGEDDEEEDKGETPTEAEPATNTTLSNSDDANTNPLALSMAQNLLSNPELLQRLQQMQQSINFQQHHDNAQMNPSNAVLGSVSTSSSFISSFQPLDLKAASHEEVDMNIVEASDDTSVVGSHAFSALPINKLYGKAEDDPESYCNNLEPSQQIAFQTRLRESLTDKRGYMESHIASRRSRSRSISPRRSRFSRSHRDKDERPRRSRSRSPWKNVDRRSYRSRSRSPRSRLDRQHERSLSPESKEREKERERRRRGLPPLRKGYLTICSTTLWLGHVPKLVSEADISDTFGEFGTINSIDLIPPRGCAYVCMNRRQDAYRALNQLKNLKLHGSTIKMAWAPGKGMKGKEFKDYWDVDLGSSYIPYDKLLNTEVDIELLEDGGMIDEDTMPESFKEVRRKKQKEPEGKASEPPAALVPLPVVPLPSAQPAQPVFGMSLTPGIMIPNVGLTQNQLPVGISQPSGLMPSIQNNGLNSTPTSLGSAMNINSSNTSSIISSQSNPMVPDTSKTDILSSLPTVSSTGQSLSHLVVPPLSSTLCVTTPSTTQTSLQLRPPVQPMLPPPLGMSSIFQPPPLNIPPPSLMAGQRPPPPMSWLSGPPPTLLPPPPPPPAPTQTIPGLRPSITAAAARVTNEKNQLLGHKLEENRLTPSNSFFSEALPPRLHGDLDDLSGAPRRMQSQNSERGRDRFRPQRVNEDPFAHSLFDIPPFERNMGTPVMPNSPRTPLFPRGLEGMSQRDHLELDRRFGRDWHPQMGSRPLLSAFEDSSRCGRAPPREWNRRDQWNRERGGRMDRGQKNRGSFNRDRGSRDRERDHDRERDRDRERDKDRERDRDRERISRWENSETEKVECTTEDHQVEPNVTHDEKPTDENGPISDFDPAGKVSEVDLPVIGNEPEHAPLPEKSDPVETNNELPAEEEPSVT